ncbi:hypothetical protein PRZ48_008364 [Zasmidium cellare]|uniref:Uncharacterized protein n=1 Tax=Zasmidium cellare TaxID=395010 RepID=A0ABR0EG49_ZASCE|nr:hypothetical protein PRZ48_008364 [Zasmidium cellare]
MAPNMPPPTAPTAPNQPHPLHEPPTTFLHRANAIRPPTIAPFTTLEIQLYTTTNHTHLLLFKPPTSHIWTIPTIIPVTDDQRTILDIALGMLKNAIEERTLGDVQVLSHIWRQPVMEMPARGRVAVKVFLSANHINLEDRIAAHADTMFEDSRWVELAAEQPRGKVKYMSPASMDVARKLLAGFGPRFEGLVQAGGLREFFVDTINTAVKIRSIELGGEAIEHVLVARCPTTLDVLYLMKANAEMLAQTQREGKLEIQDVVAVPGGGFERRRFWVVGVVVRGKAWLEGKFCSRELVGEGWRVRVEWVQETARTGLGRVGEVAEKEGP